MTESRDDADGLLARLRAADPAPATSPPSARWIAELTEATMSTPTDHHTRPERLDRPTARRWRLWVMPAAAAVAVAAVATTVWLGRSDESTGPVANLPGTSQPTVARTASSATPVTLRAGAPVATRCLMVSVAGLQRMPTAFAGTVTSVDGTTATLRVTRWYAGTAAQRAADQVAVEGMSPQLRQLVYGVDLRPGGDYLVTATREGQITACGFSAEASPRLAGMYAEAFGG